jgi:hypothetical protein
LILQPGSWLVSDVGSDPTAAWHHSDALLKIESGISFIIFSDFLIAGMTISFGTIGACIGAKKSNFQ